MTLDDMFARYLDAPEPCEDSIHPAAAKRISGQVITLPHRKSTLTRPICTSANDVITFSKRP